MFDKAVYWIIFLTRRTDGWPSLRGPFTEIALSV